MSNKLLPNIGLFLLALVFSTGLMFAFIELPQLADRFLQSVINMPDTDPAYDSFRINIFFNAYAIRLIGYICLGLILLFIILGFTTRKTGWAWLGSIALFLPVFATFANSMFYLAGLGLFNVLVFPLHDISLSFIDMGKVVLIPYWILIWFFRLFHWNAHQFLVYFFMGTGAFLFVLGVFAWFSARNNKEKVAKHWIYKYSRHPQYLGWIIWSYGLMLLGPSMNQMKKSWGWHGTLPWLLSTVVIIGICLLEEIKMREKYGEDYERYRQQTPFLFPVPDLLKRIIKAPGRLIIGKKSPTKKSDVGLVLVLYTVILIALSFIWIDQGENVRQQLPASRPFVQKQADSLVVEIQKPQMRRYRSFTPFYLLASMGEPAQPILFRLIKDSDPDIRAFGIQAAYTYNMQHAVPLFVHALHDSDLRVAHAAVEGLGNLKAIETADTLLYLLNDPKNVMAQDKILQSLSKMKCERVMPYLEKRFRNPYWYHRTSTLQSMATLNFALAKPYIYRALHDDHPRVRRESVSLILKHLPDDAIPHLETVAKDKNWDVRFYSKQAIRMIQNKTKYE